MKRRQLLKIAMAGIFSCTCLVSAQAQESDKPKTAPMSYWLGTKEGYALRFNVRVPADAMAVIRNRNKAPNRGDDTLPRYRSFTHTINGVSTIFHSTELGWETPKLDEGALTWVVEAGIGADWRECNTKDPLWKDFAAGLKALASDSEGWSSAKVVVVEGKGDAAPTVRLNQDGTMGKPSKGQLAVWKLTELNGKASLSPDELAQVREHLLAIANEGRANPSYRRQQGSRVALELPKDLKPLVQDESLTKAAQNQAEYCARIQQTTHDQEDEKYASLDARTKLFGFDKIAYEAAGSGALQDYPTSWMKSETHYRPWWNLDGQVVTVVGFGVAKGADGAWYIVAAIGE